ncbi:MAG: ACT domain-containing protein, partial [Nocardioides sp.]|uniref:ACT domain-containing protein n=1 Tax=Nocardioides sp. TaxID=35761 RepID=UPI003F0CD8A8
MLWKVRITMPDRPGALARLAQECGEAGVNILGFQVFPGVDAVTDELVIAVPRGWSTLEIAPLLERSGASFIGGNPCSEGALVDQPTRFVQAARSIVAQPARFPEVVAQLFDAEAEPQDTVQGRYDQMELVVADVLVQIHRRAPFTATEHARGTAMAELVSDVMTSRKHSWQDPQVGRRLGTGVVPTFVASSHSVTAVVEETPVARAVLA